MDYLTVTEKGVEFDRGDEHPVITFANIEQWRSYDWTGIDRFMCSSSLDFPREYTEDEAVVQLANYIRGNTV